MSAMIPCPGCGSTNPARRVDGPCENAFHYPTRTVGTIGDPNRGKAAIGAALAAVSSPTRPERLDFEAAYEKAFGWPLRSDLDPENTRYHETLNAQHLAALEGARKEEREKWRKYGSHIGNCPQQPLYKQLFASTLGNKMPEKPCNCGFDALTLEAE